MILKRAEADTTSFESFASDYLLQLVYYLVSNSAP